LEDRANLLREHGADHVLLLRTEADLLQLSAQEFFTNVVRGSLHANGMVEGPNFGFGRGREGNVETLKKCCATTGMALEIVPPLELDGQIISSSRVRESLLAGYIARASRLLGRPYRLTGQVVVGQRRGAGLGFPTANLSDVKTLVPAEGVYAVRARIGDGQEWPAAANIGPNPTFGEMLRKIEVHLIGFTGGELYGQTLTIEFVARLRDTRKFASADDLVRQLREDVAQAELSIRQTTTAMR
jgi:riboflavin kinase/FMN adenylyltransferase